MSTLIKRYAIVMCTVIITIALMMVVCGTNTNGSTDTMVYCPTSTTTHSGVTHVMVVGDSITYDASAEIMAMGSMRGMVLTMDARPGTGLYAPTTPLTWDGVYMDYSTFSWVDRIPTMVHATTPDVVVVALGTNDAFYAQLPMYTTMVERVYAMAQGAEVYWVALPERALSTDHMLRIQRVNRALAKVEAAHPDFHVIHPPTDAALFRDTAHHNQYGNVLFAKTIIDAIS